MTPRITYVAAGLITLLLSPLVAASGQVREDLIREDWARYRQNVLAVVEAMPEHLFAFRPGEDSPAFSEQIEGVVRTNLHLVGFGVVGMDAPPTMGNPRAYLGSKRELLDFVERTFNFVAESVADASGRLEETGSAPDLPPMPRWRFLELAREEGHSKLEELIPYFRLNGIEPPPFLLHR